MLSRPPPCIRRLPYWLPLTDIADSTALTERLGDAPFREKARDLDATLRTVIREHAGTPLKESSSATASWLSSLVPGMPSKPVWPAAKPVTTSACPYISASTLVTSFAKTTTSTAAR